MVTISKSYCKKRIFRGSQNIFVGEGAGVSNTTGMQNSAMGHNALALNTEGTGNVAIGRLALSKNTVGQGNSAIGFQTLLNNTTGRFNTAVGLDALEDHTTGDENVAVGVNAGFYNVTGSANVFLGSWAGCNEKGSNKLYIANSLANTLIYGEFDTKMVGINTTAPAGYTLAVNGSAAKPGGGSWSSFSDARLKEIQGQFERGLSEVRQLNPVMYKYAPDNDMNLPADKEYVGLVAQEVQGVIPEAVDENSNGYLMVNNDPIIWSMVNAIKELKAEKDAEIARLQGQVSDLAARLERMELMMSQTSNKSLEKVPR